MPTAHKIRSTPAPAWDLPPGDTLDTTHRHTRMRSSSPFPQTYPHSTLFYNISTHVASFSSRSLLLRRPTPFPLPPPPRDRAPRDEMGMGIPTTPPLLLLAFATGVNNAAASLFNVAPKSSTRWLPCTHRSNNKNKNNNNSIISYRCCGKVCKPRS